MVRKSACAPHRKTWLARSPRVTNAELKEAQFNLAYAESDERGGFHNHNYLMALLTDANSKALDLPPRFAAKAAARR